ncbi:MAG: family 43 glycosylhydrolase [Opitutae bacterium]|nr:family 43 glycosylhydrolase [Opitutae bacterium]
MKLRSLRSAATLLAALALSSAAFARAADRWDAPGAANPILPGYFADPSLVPHDGKFYLYATIDPWGGRTLGCWESSDFKNWIFRELNWPTKEACTSPTSKSAMVWAPSVIRAPDGRFMMFVSVGSEVWVGTAASPLGPWRDANGGRPLIPATWNTTYHMIDAEAFVDDDGAVYLFWGSGWGWKNGHCFAAKLNPDLVSFAGEPRDVTPAHYFEGPFLFKHAGRYYLTYSNGKTVTDTYQVHYATGPGPLGPFTEAPNSPLLVTDAAHDIVSPGHHAMFHRGAQAFILYHRHRLPFVTDTAFRQTCVDELHFTADGLIEKVRPTHAGPALVQGRAAAHLAATATASSSLDALHDAARATDDNYATRWAAAPTDRNPTLTLDLGRATRVDRLELRPEFAANACALALEVSADGERWQTLADHRAAGLRGSPLVLSVARECRYLRLTFPAAGETQTASLWECAAY